MKYGQIALAVLVLGTLAACGGEPDQAEMRAASAEVVMMLPVTTGSEEARGHFLQGQRALDLQDVREANEHFERAAEADPQFALAYLQIANTAASPEEYRTNLDRATEHAAHASETERLLIEIARAEFENDVEGQLELAEQLVAAQPESPRAWMALADAQSAAGREEEARASLTRATEVAPGFSVAYLALGNSYLVSAPRDPATGLEQIQAAVDLEPEEPTMYDFLGDAYRQLGRLEDAAEAYTRAAELDPSEGLYLQQRAHVHSFLGNYEAARDDYDAAIELAEGNTKASFALFRALVPVHAGDPRAAVEEYGRLVDEIDGMGIENPTGFKVGALSNQAFIAIHHGFVDVAERALTQRAALMREQAERVGTEEFRRQQEANIAIFGGYLAARKGDYATATQKVEEYRELRGPDRDPRKDEAVHDLLGWIELLRGNHEAAVAHYEQGNPDDIYTTYQLAVALEGAGRTEQAMELYRRVAEYRYNNAGAALVRQDAVQKAS